MKTCPSCHKTYEDDAMMFCLVDGARLLEPTTAVDPNATHVLPPPRVTEPGPTVAAPQPTVAAAQPTLRAEPELMQMRPRSYASDSSERTRSHALPWLLAIVIVLGVSGIVIALILSRSRSEPSQQVSQASTPTMSPAKSGATTTESEPTPEVTPRAASTLTPAPKPSEQPPKKITERPLPGSVTVTRAQPGPTPAPKPMFSVMNNISFNGSRITYYPRPSFGLCQADCAGNANCRGFTWIRPGAYNPGDSAMCYLMSAVTARIPHPCCISAVRN